ncbi:Unknown protein, partial [Striga hermonthica]
TDKSRAIYVYLVILSHFMISHIRVAGKSSRTAGERPTEVPGRTQRARSTPGSSSRHAGSVRTPVVRTRRQYPAVQHRAAVVMRVDVRSARQHARQHLRIVDEWVQGLEMIFEVMDCPDRYQVLCAQIQLTGDARLWWNTYWSMRPGEKEGCTWDQFKELIRGKYYPSYYRADIKHQFLALTQGTRSVDEYEREFTRLGAF